MLFVQEENYGTLLEDIEEKNDVEVSINVGTGDIEAITTFYGELLAVFKENKNSVTADAIIAFIGDRITITE